MVDVWVLVDIIIDSPGEATVRVCGTFLDHHKAREWALSRDTRNSIKVPLDALADGEVL